MVRTGESLTAVATPPGGRPAEPTEQMAAAAGKKTRGPGRTVAIALTTLVLGAGGTVGALHRLGKVQIPFLSGVAFLSPNVVPAPPPAAVAPATTSKPAEQATTVATTAPDHRRDERDRPTPRPVLLGMKEVSAAMLKRRTGIVGCGESNRGAIPADGRVVVRMKIDPSGSVGVNVVSPGVESTGLGACLTKQLRQLKFPKNRNDPPLIVEFPLRFSQQ
jgi:hypothetical protein